MRAGFKAGAKDSAEALPVSGSTLQTSERFPTDPVATNEAGMLMPCVPPARVANGDMARGFLPSMVYLFATKSNRHTEIDQGTHST